MEQRDHTAEGRHVHHIFKTSLWRSALVLMMRFLDRVSFTPYVVYRVLLGVVLLVVTLQ